LVGPYYSANFINEDPAYPQRRWFFGGYQNPPLTIECLFNHAMSGVRKTVEWGFKEVITQFSYLDFKAGMKIFLQPVETYFFVAAFFCNLLHTC
jgi:hypothetical protein